MDKRIILPEGFSLSFPGMYCKIESLVGKGSNAIVYLGSYPDQQRPDLRHRVLIKELFPYHPHGAIYRDERNCIQWDEEGADTMHLHRSSFCKGNEVHIRLHSGHPGDMDANMNTFSLHNTLYSVLGFSGGRSLDRELDAPEADKTALFIHIRRLLGALHVLEAFHQSGYLHLDISPDNILLIGNGKKERVSLIDYNSVHTLEEIRSGTGLYYSAKEGYTAPEIRMGRISSVGFSTDLYALTCVFYRCITGKKLSPLEMVHRSVPDLSGSKCLEDLPDTALSMVRRILKRGLASVGSRRYKNVAAMRQDLEELQDRIDGKGITHWALWETGRASALHIIKVNPALEYIRDEEKVYTAVGAQEDGASITLPEIFHRLTQTRENCMTLLGGGGMGKTTALLRMAYLQQPRYSAASPAVVYISLYGWNDSGDDYIKGKILENLKFKPETASLETARHELLCLLSAPLYTRWGEKPKLALLLDGFNEAVGDTAPLLKEIVELSKMPGVGILLTSRSPVAALFFPEIELRRLKEEESAAILAKNGILPPENPHLLELLRTPMMLSVFVQAALNGQKQLFTAQQEQDPREYLLSAYLSALLEKEKKNVPEDSAKGWSAEAAVYYLLPEIAYFLKTKGASVSDRELLPLVKKCYGRLNKRDMTAVFPQWIGHLSAIQGGAKNAEEWYGQMIHGILWRRLGLIIREENGNYRMSHQMIEDYLAEIRQGFARKFIRRRRVRTGFFVALFLLLLGASWRWVYVPYRISKRETVKEHYDRALADNVLGSAFGSYASLAKQYESAQKVLACVQKSGGAQEDENAYARSLVEFDAAVDAAAPDHTEREMGYMKELLNTGEVMPWSQKPLDTEAFEEFVALPADWAKEYKKYMDILRRLRGEREIWEEFGASYVQDFSEAIECDAFVIGKYYKILIEPELRAMEESDDEENRYLSHQYLSAGADYAQQNEIMKDSSDSLEQYQRNRVEAWRRFRANEAIHIDG